MVLDRDLTSFKIISVIMALLVAAFVLMQSYVRADAIVFETLGAAVAAFGGFSGLGLAAVAVVLVAFMVLGYETTNMDLGGFSPEQIVRVTDKAIEAIGVAQMTLLCNAVVAGELVLTTVIMPAWNALLEFIRETMSVTVLSGGEAISFVNGGLHDVIMSLAPNSLGTQPISSTISLETGKAASFDFSSALTALVGLSSVGSPSMYVTTVWPSATAGTFRALAIVCDTVSTFMGASVSSSTPVHCYRAICFAYTDGSSGYNLITQKGLMDYNTAIDGISSSVAYVSPFLYDVHEISNCIAYYISNGISYTWSDVACIAGTLTQSFYAKKTFSIYTFYFVYGLAHSYYTFFSNEIVSLVTDVSSYAFASSSSNKIVLASHASGSDCAAGIFTGTIPFAVWLADTVALAFTGLTQREVAGEVQVGNVAGDVAVGGSVAIPLPNVDNPDIAIPIPDIGVLAPDIAATIPDIAAEIAQPFIDVFVPIGDVIFNLPDIIGDFVSPAADSISGLAGAVEDAFGIFKFWYDWRDAA